MDLNLPTITFFTKRVIRVGEELSFDYNMKLSESYAEDKIKQAQGLLNGHDKDDLDDDNSNSSGVSSYHNDEVNRFAPRCKCKCGTTSCRLYYM